MIELPGRWRWVQLQDVAAPVPSAITDGPFGSNLKTEHYTLSGPRVIRLQNIGHGVFLTGDEAHISTDHFQRLRKHEAIAGDLVIAALGEILPRACIVPPGLGQAIVKADCIRVRVRSDADPTFIMWMLNAPPLRREATALISGVGRPRLNLGKIRALRLPLPPLDEQRRIVEIVEEQFSRLDAAEASLRKSSNRLPRLAISVMNELLSRDWPVVPASEVAEVRLGRQRAPKNHSGPSMRPYLRAANVTWHGLALSDVKEMNFSDTEAPIYELRSGDILIAEASGSASEVGKTAIWRDEIPGCCFQNTLLRVRAKDKVAPEYLLAVFQLAALSGQFGRAAAGVGIHHLGAQRLNSWPVPLPPLDEQQRIVSGLQRCLSVLEDVGKAAAAVRRRSAALQRAILEQAFSGNLTRQYGLAARISGHALGDNARIEIGVG